MAVLGIQMVITMVVASTMSKIGPFYSFARWILTSTGLVRYQHPTDEELKLLAGLPLNFNSKAAKALKKERKARNGNAKASTAEAADLETFSVPRSLEVTLDLAPVQAVDVVQLRFYPEYQWLLDFSFYALAVFGLTEIYGCLNPAILRTEVNLSMVWCLLVSGFAYKVLVSLNKLYFLMEEGGERSLVVVMGFVYLLLAMMILIVHEDTLETGLDEAYDTFNRSAAVFLADNAGLDSSGPASKLVLKFFLALWCGSIGALFTFPGLRLAKMQWDVLKHSEGRGLITVLSHAAFIAPLLLTIFWIKPLSRDYLTERVFAGMEGPVMSAYQFESLRMNLILVVILLRIAVMPVYLQSYLNIAFYKMEEMRSEAGKITNLEIQRTVTRVFYYLCVVTLQYIAPMIMVLFTALMYKTVGGGTWSGVWISADDFNSYFPPILAAAGNASAPAAAAPSLDAEAVAGELGDGQFSLAWHSLKQVFTPAVFRGLFGFSTWWCCLSWFLSSAIGLTYQSYFAQT